MLRRQEKIKCLFLAVSWTLKWDRVLASAGPGHQAPIRKKAGLRCLSPEQRGSLVMLQTKERHPALHLEEVDESDLNCRSIYPILPHAKSAFQTQIWFCLLPDSWQDRSWLPSWNFLCLVIWTSFSLVLRTGTDQILGWIFLFLTSSFFGCSGSVFQRFLFYTHHKPNLRYSFPVVGFLAPISDFARSLLTPGFISPAFYSVLLF